MKKILLSLMSGILLCSCQTNPYALDSATYHYQLNGTPISISFNAKEKRFSGKVVNNYFGTYEQSEEAITLHPLGATMMMGPENAMQAEQHWIQLLTKVKTIQKTENGLILTLNNNQKLMLSK